MRTVGSGKFTPLMRAKVPEWVAQGMTPEDMAAVIGITVDSFKSMCAKFGISLGHHMRMRISDRAYQAIQQQAAQMSIDEKELVWKIIETVASEDLFKALELT